MCQSYVGIILAAVLPIAWGSWRSLKLHKARASGRVALTLTEKWSQQASTFIKDKAIIIPFITSIDLLSLYLVLSVFRSDTIDSLLVLLLSVFDIVSSSRFFSVLLEEALPEIVVERKLDVIQFHNGMVTFNLSSSDLFYLATSILLETWYFTTRHWVLNNTIAIAFAVNVIELLHLDSVNTGCTIMIGLCIQDVLLVFVVPVMPAIMTSLRLPCKLTIPLRSGGHIMLGLGDILIPGTFIALLLRFDDALHSGSNLYFRAGLLGYVIGLMVSVLATVSFRSVQPALLYLVPACLGVPMLLARHNGDLQAMLEYSDFPIKTVIQTLVS